MFAFLAQHVESHLWLKYHRGTESLCPGACPGPISIRPAAQRRESLAGWRAAVGVVAVMMEAVSTVWIFCCGCCTCSLIVTTLAGCLGILA